MPRFMLLLMPFVMIVTLEAQASAQRTSAAGRRSGSMTVGCGDDVGLRRILALMIAYERILDGAVLGDEEHRGTADVPGVEADAVPDAVGLGEVAALVDQDVEGEPGFFDVAAHGLAILREDPGHLDSAGGVSGDVGGELTEPVAAVGSPGAAMEGQEQPSPREEIRKRTGPALLVGHQETWRLLQRRSVHQNSLTSTVSPASTMSTLAGISM